MNCGAFVSNVKNTILFYMQVPANTENEDVKLKLVDVNLTFIPIYGIEVKRIITDNKNVLIFDKVKSTISELYEGDNIYIVIEITENKSYDCAYLCNIKLGIDISYYDVETDKKNNILLNSSSTSASSEQLEAVIRNIKSCNRKRIQPHSNTTNTITFPHDDMDVFLFDDYLNA